MSTFPINENEYSVEEISYEDMMSLLENQERNHSDPSASLSQELQKSPESSTTENHPESDKQISRQDQLSARITANVNRQLPSWLLNH